MTKYIFILGQSPELSRQELVGFFKGSPQAIIRQGNNFTMAEIETPATELLPNLGGTIKIAKFLDEFKNLSELSTAKWQNYLVNQLDNSKKVNPAPLLNNQKRCRINFGFSLYNDSDKNYQILKRNALQLKKELKNQGHKVRLVVGQSPELSSVIVNKNNLVDRELIVIKENNNYLVGLTEAVQDFVKYGQIDMDRPCRDNRSGMLPPKIAQIMINLAGSNRDCSILDPFCGSGTILQQAMLMGFKTIYGTDISKKAIDDTVTNLKWTRETFQQTANFKIQKADAKNLGETFKNNSIDLIVTEPFMGDAQFVYKQNKLSALQNTKSELQNLYINAFRQFKKILTPQGQVVFIFPIFEINGQQLATLNDELLTQLGFVSQLDKEIIYRRPRQKVLRQITLYKIA